MFVVSRPTACTSASIDSTGDPAGKHGELTTCPMVRKIHETRKNQLLWKLRLRQPGQRMYPPGSRRTGSTALARCAVAVFLLNPAGCTGAPQHRGFSVGSGQHDCRREVSLARPAKSPGSDLSNC